jgi:hypothetical protein
MDDVQKNINEKLTSLSAVLLSNDEHIRVPKELEPLEERKLRELHHRALGSVEEVHSSISRFVQRAFDEDFSIPTLDREHEMDFMCKVMAYEAPRTPQQLSKDLKEYEKERANRYAHSTSSQKESFAGQIYARNKHKEEEANHYDQAEWFGLATYSLKQMEEYAWEVAKIVAYDSQAKGYLTEETMPLTIESQAFKEHPLYETFETIHAKAAEIKSLEGATKVAVRHFRQEQLEANQWLQTYGSIGIATSEEAGTSDGYYGYGNLYGDDDSSGPTTVYHLNTAQFTPPYGCWIDKDGHELEGSRRESSAEDMQRVTQLPSFSIDLYNVYASSELLLDEMVSETHPTVEALQAGFESAGMKIHTDDNNKPFIYLSELCNQWPDPPAPIPIQYKGEERLPVMNAEELNKLRGTLQDTLEHATSVLENVGRSIPLVLTAGDRIALQYMQDANPSILRDDPTLDERPENVKKQERIVNNAIAYLDQISATAFEQRAMLVGLNQLMVKIPSCALPVEWKAVIETPDQYPQFYAILEKKELLSRPIGELTYQQLQKQELDVPGETVTLPKREKAATIKSAKDAKFTREQIASQWDKVKDTDSPMPDAYLTALTQHIKACTDERIANKMLGQQEKYTAHNVRLDQQKIASLAALDQQEIASLAALPEPNPEQISRLLDLSAKHQMPIDEDTLYMQADEAGISAEILERIEKHNSAITPLDNQPTARVENMQRQGSIKTQANKKGRWE